MCPPSLQNLSAQFEVKLERGINVTNKSASIHSYHTLIRDCKSHIYSFERSNTLLKEVLIFEVQRIIERFPVPKLPEYRYVWIKSNTTIELIPTLNSSESHLTETP